MGTLPEGLAWDGRKWGCSPNSSVDTVREYHDERE